MNARRCLASVAIVLSTALALALSAAPAFAEPGDAPVAAATASALAGGVQTQEAQDDDGSQSVQTFYVQQVNPIYAEELAGVDLFDDAVDSDLRQSGDPPAGGLLSLQSGGDGKKGAAAVSCSSRAEATARIREALLAHASTVALTIKTDEGYGGYALPMFNAALYEPRAGDSQEYRRLVDYLRYEYAAVSGTCTALVQGGVYTVTYEYTIVYNSTKAQSDQLLADAEALVASFGFGSTTSTFDKFRAIYNFVCGNVTYDFDHLNDSNYRLKYTAYAALENGTAVCQGYSELLYVMCGYAGVPARIVSGLGYGSGGAGEPHSWNIVGLPLADGSSLYYNVDSTWDSPNYQVRPYEYYLLSDADFSDHKRGVWGDESSPMVDYASSAFYAAHPMASRSYTGASSDFETKVVAPTCTKDGYTLHVCASTAESYITDKVKALGHRWGTGAVTVKPTTAKVGKKTYSCTRCSATKTETLPALVAKPKARSFTYNGKSLVGVAAGKGYTLSGTTRATNAGTYTAVAKLNKGLTWADGSTASVKLTWRINRAPQSIKAAKTYAVKASKVASKDRKIAVKFKVTGRGKVTYKAAKTAKGKVKIAKNGKVTVAKGTKKGVYVLKVKVTAAAKGNYAKTTKTVKLKVRVK